MLSTIAWTLIVLKATVVLIIKLILQVLLLCYVARANLPGGLPEHCSTSNNLMLQPLQYINPPQQSRARHQGGQYDVIVTRIFSSRDKRCNLQSGGLEAHNNTHAGRRPPTIFCQFLCKQHIRNTIYSVTEGLLVDADTAGTVAGGLFVKVSPISLCSTHTISTSCRSSAQLNSSRALLPPTHKTVTVLSSMKSSTRSRLFSWLGLEFRRNVLPANSLIVPASVRDRRDSCAHQRGVLDHDRLWYLRENHGWLLNLQASGTGPPVV
jgi:hypothetical protein